MGKNDKNIGVAIIELFQPHNNGDYNWGQISMVVNMIHLLTNMKTMSTGLNYMEYQVFTNYNTHYIFAELKKKLSYEKGISKNR